MFAAFVMRTLKFTFIFLFFSQLVFAQLDNSSLYFNTEIDTTHEKEFFVKIQNLNFMKDNEYSNLIADGYTLFGVQLNPQFGYKLSKNLSIEAGIFFSKDFGNKKFTEVAPTFSLRYYKKDFKLVFGNLDGSLNHGLIEPLYNFERIMTNRLENGTQITLNKKYFDFDVWVDWLNMIYKFSNTQEKLMAGIHANVFKYENNDWIFQLPFQGTIVHKGGQIDTINAGTHTNFSYAVGIVLTKKLQHKFIKSVFVDTRYTLRSNNYYDAPKMVSNTWGDGFYGNIGIKGAYKTDLLFSYWLGDWYYNELGGDLYQSRSRTVAYGRYWRERFRELLIMRVTKTVELTKGANLMLRVEPYYDFRNRDLEFSFGFYLGIDERLWISRKS